MSDAVISSEMPAPYPATASATPSRALGVTALVTALVPLTLLALTLLAALVVLPAIPGGSSLDVSWLLLIGGVLLYGGPVLGLAGLILGIIAVRRNRGRGAGIAAIVIGGLTFLYLASSWVIQLLVALTYSSGY
jgi:hypothetical protein